MGVIELWCNGNTPLFGGGIIGSNPVSSTNYKWGCGEKVDSKDLGSFVERRVGSNPIIPTKLNKLKDDN